MFKKLDKLIVKAFIGPFIATFFITVLVLVMQFFWLWIDDFVGKGLDATIIFKFIWYQCAVLVPLALPLAILLSSLMTFGNLGETFELVAIKSAGISLLRFMQPLFIVTVLISILAFAFSNNVIPVATLKSRTLLSDIVHAKPAFNLKEGVFYDKIPGFAIKVGKKEANDSIIQDIIIYESSNSLQDNFIVAESGVMKTNSENSRLLEFNLKNGIRYEERGDRYGAKAETEYIRMGFKEYKKIFDLSTFILSLSSDSTNKGNEKMFTMRQLNVAIDSIKKENSGLKENLTRETYRYLPLAIYLDSMQSKANYNFKDSTDFGFFKRDSLALKDSLHRKDSLHKIDSIHRKDSIDKRKAKTDSLKKKTAVPKVDTAGKQKKIDSVANAAKKDSNQLKQDSLALAAKRIADSTAAAEEAKLSAFYKLLPDSAKINSNNRALSQVNSLRTNLESSLANYKDKERILRRHKIEWHKKITLSLSCLVLFLIGAPLGSIIRKGGLGTPLVIAIIFFMIFFFTNSMGEKLAKEGSLTPFLGVWLATFVLVPIGLFLTYKALHDSQLFNKEFYQRLSRKLRAALKRK